VTEGFGERPMATATYELLAAHHGEETSLSAQGSIAGNQPEIFIPAISTEKEPLNAQPLAPLVAGMNARVRLLAPPQEGVIGRIVGIARRPQVLESGVVSLGAEVEPVGGGRVFAPWQNLELID
jgi:hypothetical protein